LVNYHFVVISGFLYHVAVSVKFVMLLVEFHILG
jgi:hypothetical protein